MKVGHMNVTRPDWWDRSSAAISRGYSANNIGPHGATTRWTYTVPSNRKMFLANCMAHLIRRGVGAAGGDETLIEVTVNPAGAEPAAISVTARVFDPTVGATDSMVIGSGPVLYVGDVISAVTSYPGAAGTADFNVAMLGTEFQAN